MGYESQAIHRRQGDFEASFEAIFSHCMHPAETWQGSRPFAPPYLPNESYVPFESRLIPSIQPIASNCSFLSKGHFAPENGSFFSAAERTRVEVIGMPRREVSGRGLNISYLCFLGVFFRFHEFGTRLYGHGALLILYTTLAGVAQFSDVCRKDSARYDLVPRVFGK